MRHQTWLRVRFGHADPAGIAYYPRYFEWFHDGFEDFVQGALGAPYAEVLARWGVGFPAVQSACEWRAPTRFGERLSLEVFLSRLTPRSATVEYRLSREGLLCATASVKVVGMDMQAHAPRPFPDEVQAALAPYVEPLGSDGPDAARLRG
jgi:4-hydroxybenzoyl-CoA thioesterase